MCSSDQSSGRSATAEARTRRLSITTARADIGPFRGSCRNRLPSARPKQTAAARGELLDCRMHVVFPSACAAAAGYPYSARHARGLPDERRDAPRRADSRHLGRDRRPQHPAHLGGQTLSAIPTCMASCRPLVYSQVGKKYAWLSYNYCRRRLCEETRVNAAAAACEFRGKWQPTNCWKESVMRS